MLKECGTGEKSWDFSAGLRGADKSNSGADKSDLGAGRCLTRGCDAAILKYNSPKTPGQAQSPLIHLLALSRCTGLASSFYIIFGAVCSQRSDERRSGLVVNVFSVLFLVPAHQTRTFVSWHVALAGYPSVSLFQTLLSHAFLLIWNAQSPCPA